MLKNKCLSLYMIILFIFIFYSSSIKALNLPLIDTVITIDPGHGGRDPGTTYNNTFEKDINLEISKELEKQLGKMGAITYMTRTRDEDLSSIYDPKKKRGDLYRRLLLIKKNNSDLYLSIHINWYKNSSYKGAEVLYNGINPKNKLLATSIMNEFSKTLSSTRKIKKTDLYMYRNITVPGVLIECGYLSNYYERNALKTKEYQEKLAQVITDGVIKYIENINKKKDLYF